ncbi:hypothetical protein SCUP515_00103 [Seiridium cupressi]
MADHQARDFELEREARKSSEVDGKVEQQSGESHLIRQQNHYSSQLVEENKSTRKSTPATPIEARSKVELIGRNDGHRAPPAASWITDEELWFMDWAFRDTVKELLGRGVKFELARFQGCPNFPPLLLDRGYGVALCIRRTKAVRDAGPIRFNSEGDEEFVEKLHNLAFDIRMAKFRHRDLIWSIRITTFFARNHPANAPRWWSPRAELDSEECEFVLALPQPEMLHAQVAGTSGSENALPGAPPRKQPHRRATGSSSPIGTAVSLVSGPGNGTSMAGTSASLRISETRRSSRTYSSKPDLQRWKLEQDWRDLHSPRHGRNEASYKTTITQRPRWRPAG